MTERLRRLVINAISAVMLEMYVSCSYNVREQKVTYDGRYLHVVDIISLIADKNDKAAYEFSKQISAASVHSPEYYPCIDEFASLLHNKNSYIRTRAFILICSQARWDSEGKIHKLLPEMFTLLHDPKSTAVRQCLNAVKEVAVFRPELAGIIRQELSTIDFLQYKDSMAPLIRKDINSVLELLDEAENQNS